MGESPLGDRVRGAILGAFCPWKDLIGSPFAGPWMLIWGSPGVPVCERGESKGLSWRWGSVVESIGGLLSGRIGDIQGTFLGFIGMSSNIEKHDTVEKGRLPCTSIVSMC